MPRTWQRVAPVPIRAARFSSGKCRSTDPKPRNSRSRCCCLAALTLRGQPLGLALFAAMPLTPSSLQVTDRTTTRPRCCCSWRSPSLNGCCAPAPFHRARSRVQDLCTRMAAAGAHMGRPRRVHNRPFGRRSRRPAARGRWCGARTTSWARSRSRGRRPQDALLLPLARLYRRPSISFSLSYGT